MYQVTLKNGSEEIVVNAVSTDDDAPRISGSAKYGINTIDNFSFAITPNNAGYSKINALTTLIEILNTRTAKFEFKGRVLIPFETMDSSGKLIKTVTCESELGYLMDSSTVYGEFHNISVRDFLKVIIDNHNSQVSSDKQFVLGNVTVQDNNDSLYRYLGYAKTLDAIKDKLINRLGGELQIRYENGTRYLDYLAAVGSVKDTEIRLSKNLQTIEQEKDPTSIITRLIPLGTKLENSEERLNISSVNNGLNYIDDSAAMAQFGVIVDIAMWDDVTEASNLLTKGQGYLSANNRIKKKYKIGALDLSTIGLDFDSFEVGNYYPVNNSLMNINESLRVIEKNIDINSPQNSTLTVGDKFEDIKAYQLGITDANKTIQTVSENLNTTVSAVGSVNTQLNNTVDVVNQTNEVLANTNQTVADLTQTISNINQSLQDNITKTSELTTTTTNIQNNLNDTNAKLEKLKKRMFMGV